MQVERKILLNPGPATTTDSVKSALVVEDICPREQEFGAVLENIKHDLVKVVHGEEHYTSAIFAASGTGAMEAAITSAVPKNKKLLVIENGAYGKRMIQIANTYSIEVVAHQIPYGDYPDLDDIRKILETEDAISHLAIVHHETTTGMLNPIKEITELAHAYHVEVIIDAMSSYAGIPINMEELDAEYLLSSSNKCIQGMAGLSFVIFKKALLEKIKDNRRSYYLDIYSQYTGFENTGQMQFTPPVQVVYALKQAIKEYFKEGEKGRWERYSENWDTLYSGLQSLGFRFLIPYEQQSKILLAIIEPDHANYDFNQMHDFLYERGYTIYPGKGAKESTFRLSVLGDLHKKDVENFLNELKKYLNTAKIIIG